MTGSQDLVTADLTCNPCNPCNCVTVTAVTVHQCSSVHAPVAGDRRQHRERRAQRVGAVETTGAAPFA